MTLSELQAATLDLSWRERWCLLWMIARSLLTFQQQKMPPTVLERMGDLPQHWLHEGNLADRDLRRAALANRIKQSITDQQ